MRARLLRDQSSRRIDRRMLLHVLFFFRRSCLAKLIQVQHNRQSRQCLAYCFQRFGKMGCHGKTNEYRPRLAWFPMEKPNKDDMKKHYQDNDEKVINGTMPSEKVVEYIYSQPDPKPYD